MVLSDLTNGHPSKELDDKTAAFFFGCLTKLAKSVKENDDDKEETYLDSLEFNKLSATKTYRSKVNKHFWFMIFLIFIDFSSRPITFLYQMLI